MGRTTFTAEGVRAWGRDEFIALHPHLLNAGEIWDSYNPKPAKQQEKPEAKGKTKATE